MVDFSWEKPSRFPVAQNCPLRSKERVKKRRDQYVKGLTDLWVTDSVCRTVLGAVWRHSGRGTTWLTWELWWSQG